MEHLDTELKGTLIWRIILTYMPLKFTMHLVKILNYSFITAAQGQIGGKFIGKKLTLAFKIKTVAFKFFTMGAMKMCIM